MRRSRAQSSLDHLDPGDLMHLRQTWSVLFILATAPAAWSQTPIRPAREASAAIRMAKAPGPLHPTFDLADTLRPVPTGTYAREGAIAVGLLGAVAGGFLAELSCGLSEDANKTCTGSFLLGGVIGGALGAIPGAIIGGLFPKYPKNTRVVDPEGVPDRPTDAR